MQEVLFKGYLIISRCSSLMILSFFGTLFGSKIKNLLYELNGEVLNDYRYLGAVLGGIIGWFSGKLLLDWAAIPAYEIYKMEIVRNPDKKKLVIERYVIPAATAILFLFACASLIFLYFLLIPPNIKLGKIIFISLIITPILLCVTGISILKLKK